MQKSKMQKNVQMIIFAKTILGANVIQGNVFISENERRTGFDVNTSRENYLVASFYMVHLIIIIIIIIIINQKHI